MELAVGQSVECGINTVAFGSSGIARVGNRVVFVPFTVDGDRVIVEISAIKKNYCLAYLKEIVSPSPHRVSPRCPYYSSCGGCQYQHIGYEHQLLIKERQVKETFQRIGEISFPVMKPIIPSPRTFNYRKKAEVHLARSGNESIKAGFVNVDGDTVIDIERCDLVDEDINKQYAELRKKLVSDAVPVRKNRITLWTGRSISPAQVAKTVKERMFIVPSQEFFQANGSLVDLLIDYVVDAAEYGASDTVVDCYCGCGLFASFLAPRVKKVIGIEENRKSSAAARKNLKNHGCSNARILEGRAEKVIKTQLLRKNIPVDTVILDPPRIGCPKRVLKDIMELSPRRIVYLSCNPATQARDIAFLLKGNYILNHLQPFDMFPQTKHIEVLALLERKD